MTEGLCLKAIEDNAGELHIFALRGDAVVWGACYDDIYLDAEDAAHDFAHIAHHPNEVSVYEFGAYADLRDVIEGYAQIECDGGATDIASWYEDDHDVPGVNPDLPWIRPEGSMGRQFMDALCAYEFEEE